MFTGSATLILDLGNSDNRLAVKVGSKTSGIVSVSNRFASIRENYEIPSNYDNTSSIVFRAPASKDSTELALFAHGDLADREFSKSLIKPFSGANKWEAHVSLLSFHQALLKGYSLLADITGSNLSSMDVIWDVVVLCPPTQMAKKQELEKNLSRLTQLDVVYPYNLTIPLKFDSFKVVPEGLSAFFALVFRDDRSTRSEFEHLRYSDALVADIGAGTTDFAVVSEFSALANTLDSYAVGGNTVYQRVGKEIKEQFGRNLTETALMKATIDCKITVGATEVDITDLVNQVKSDVAGEIASAIRRTFETSNYDPQQVSHLLVVGGGALQGKSTPLGEHLINSIEEFSPHVALLDVPEELDLRQMNLIGARLQVK